MRCSSALWFAIVPVLAAAQACRDPQPEPYVPFSVNYDVTTLLGQPGFDTVPVLSSASVDLVEASGGVHCSWAPQAIWVIEDGGAGSMLYLVNTTTGRVLSRLQLNIWWTNEDWEDLAHWTDSNGQHWLGIGDIGDNNGVSPMRRIFALKEPTGVDTVATGIQSYAPIAPKVWTFTYQDGPRDAESMFADPDGRIYLVSKRDMRNRLYVLPAEPTLGGDVALFLGDLPVYMSTAADRLTLPSGRSPIVLRSYGRIYYWDAAPSESACDVLQRVPTQLPYTEQEAQGEIFAWLKDGTYVLLSEKAGGVEPRVHRYLKQ